MEFKISSDTIGQISEALAKAQGSMGMALKDSNNPFFKSKYADLASIQGACQKPLSDNSLSFSFSLTIVDGVNIVVGTLSHISGEWFRSYMPVVTQKLDMQSIGSAISYARRYVLSALCGVAVCDDDGEATMDRKASSSSVNPGNASDAQIKFLANLMSSMTGQEIMDICKKHKVTEPKMLTAAQASEEINRIQEMRKKNG